MRKYVCKHKRSLNNVTHVCYIIKPILMETRNEHTAFAWSSSTRKKKRVAKFFLVCLFCVISWQLSSSKVKITSFFSCIQAHKYEIISMSTSLNHFEFISIDPKGMTGCKLSEYISHMSHFSCLFHAFFSLSILNISYMCLLHKACPSRNCSYDSTEM